MKFQATSYSYTDMKSTGFNNHATQHDLFPWESNQRKMKKQRNENATFADREVYVKLRGQPTLG